MAKKPASLLPQLPTPNTDRINLAVPVFLAALNRCFGLSELAQLRECINSIKTEFASPSGLLACAEPAVDTEAVGREYVLGELDQILAAQTLDRAKYYVQRLLRSFSETRFAPYSEINLNRWKEYSDLITDSLWLIDQRDRSGAHSASYWGNFVPQIPYQLMRRFTRAGEWVIDTFAGSGTTLIEGQRLGRNTIGVELQAHMVEHIRTLIHTEPNPHHTVAEVHHGDALTTDYQALLDAHGVAQADLAILHPPYHDIIQFSTDERDLSNSPSVRQFVGQMADLAERVGAVLGKGRTLALIISDKYSQGQWIPLGFLTMEAMLARGYSLKSIVVKNFDETAGKRSKHELWRYRALAGGFYVFKHEYIFLLRRSG